MFKTKKEQPVAEGAVASSGIQYTSGDVARIAGVSLRQLQWWDERNVVSPVQEGHRRVYRQQEVIEVSVIAELRRKGFSLQKDPPRAEVPAKGNGQAAGRCGGGQQRYPPDHGREEYLPRRSARPHYRRHEERETADVPGLRHRSVAPVSASRNSQTRPKRGGGGKRGSPSAVRLAHRVAGDALRRSSLADSAPAAGFRLRRLLRACDCGRCFVAQIRRGAVARVSAGVRAASDGGRPR